MVEFECYEEVQRYVGSSRLPLEERSIRQGESEYWLGASLTADQEPIITGSFTCTSLEEALEVAREEAATTGRYVRVRHSLRGGWL